MLEDKYIVFDVETPNKANDRICSLGITEIENENIIKTQNFIINPECSFDSLNILIHGINECDVINSETFPYVWEKIRSLFFDRIVIAHNACFDLSVLRKTLIAYGLDEQAVYYIDTIKAAQVAYPNLPNYKLNTICEYLGIALNHHDSGSDCRATAELFLNICHRGVQIGNYVNTYHLNGCPCKGKNTSPKSRLSSESHALFELQEILENITEDSKIDLTELNQLHQWIESHSLLKGNYPYNTVYCQIEAIFDDGIVEEDELRELSNVCKRLIDPVSNNCDCKDALIEVSGKNIVLSGEFSFGTKSEVEKILVSRGAIIQKSVTQKTNIVLIGNMGNDAWFAGNYGTKVKKAMELQAKGLQIMIIKENDYFID